VVQWDAGRAADATIGVQKYPAQKQKPGAADGAIGLYSVGIRSCSILSGENGKFQREAVIL
jgi:hypothetical protein|tara:strand:- start:180 stop:362 length:183 start_codon:yes stop_codon:yes gene_type:complete